MGPTVIHPPTHREQRGGEVLEQRTEQGEGRGGSGRRSSPARRMTAAAVCGKNGTREGVRTQQIVVVRPETHGGGVAVVRGGRAWGKKWGGGTGGKEGRAWGAHEHEGGDGD